MSKKDKSVEESENGTDYLKIVVIVVLIGILVFATYKLMVINKEKEDAKLAREKMDLSIAKTNIVRRAVNDSAALGDTRPRIMVDCTESFNDTVLLFVFDVANNDSNFELEFDGLCNAVKR
jgi:hypothetical protein